MKVSNISSLTAAIFLFSLISLSTSAPDPNFWIFLAFGQNNMLGCGKWEDKDREIDERFVMMPGTDMPSYERYKYNWYPAYPPLCQQGYGVSPPDYFGKTLLEKLPKNIKIGIISVAFSGARIDLFDEDLKDDILKEVTEDWFLYGLATTYNNSPYKALINSAKEAQYDGVIKGILLHQAEANIADLNGEWAPKVKKVYEDILRDLNLKEEDTPLLVGEVVRSEYGSRFGVMNEQIAKITQYVNNSHIISSEGLDPGVPGSFQFNLENQRILGRRYGEKMLELLPKFEDYSKIKGQNLKANESNSGLTAFLVILTIGILGAGGFFLYKRHLAKGASGLNSNTPLFAN